MEATVYVKGDFARAGNLLRIFGWLQVAMLAVVAVALVILPLSTPFDEGFKWVDPGWYPVLVFGFLQALAFLASEQAVQEVWSSAQG